METITVFCAHCQMDTGQSLVANVVDAAELISTCSQCGRQLKWPAGLTPSQFDDLLLSHREANQGQQPYNVAPAPGPVMPAEPSAVERPVDQTIGGQVEVQSSPTETNFYDPNHYGTP